MSKKALLIGMSYFRDPNPLHFTIACINDVVVTKYFLESQYDHKPEDIKLLIDHRPRYPKFVPQTEDNSRLETSIGAQKIMKNLLEMVQNARPGDRLFFMISGHGVRREKDGSVMGISTIGDENDSAAYVTGRELKKILRKKPKGVKLTTMVVCCYASGIIDQTGAARRFLHPTSGSRGYEHKLGIFMCSAVSTCYSHYFSDWGCEVSDFVYTLWKNLMKDKRVKLIPLFKRIDKFFQKLHKKNNIHRTINDKQQRPALYCSADEEGSRFLQ